MRFQARPVTLFCCFFLSVFVLSGQSPSDLDNDLVPDAVETLWEMDPSDPTDAILDLDGDGLSAQLEYATGGDPGVRDKVIQIDAHLMELKVRELISPETTRVFLGWSENLMDWNRAVLSDAAYYSNGLFRSSNLDFDSPIGTVREWTYQLTGGSAHFFRVEVEREPRGSEYAAVFRKLHKGVNLDVSRPSSGAWFKIQHNASQMQAIAEAGFESVRIFMPYFANVRETEQQIIDALDNNLAIVVCMWGLRSWAGNVSLGERQIAQKWGDLARRWKDYPSDLVIEILNEPRGIEFTSASSHANVMRIYNAAAQAIRDEDPDRPILMGVPGYNDSEFLDPYVTEDHLTYTFDGGKGFYDDPNTGVAIHFYAPRHEDGLNFAFWTQRLGNNESRWKDPITNQIMYAVEWRERIGVDKPIITTEWGCWLFPARDNSGDVERWLDHHFDLFNTRDIGSMWYTGIMHNQRSFGIFNSELGWHPIVTPRLTGLDAPTVWPHIDQVINGEFFSDDGWRFTTNEITRNYLRGGAFSGSTMLKLTVPQLPNGGQFYLQTFVTNPEDKVWVAPGRTLLHLIEGQTYRISFIARSSDGRSNVEKGRIKVLLKDVHRGEVFYDSSEIIIETIKTTYDLFYTHTTTDALNVRLEFDVGLQPQVLYLDKVEFIRHGPSGDSAMVDSDSE